MVDLHCVGEMETLYIYYLNTT